MKNLVNQFKQHFTPLQQLLILGFLVRLLSVFYSKGFGWSDDHFLIIETSASWADGFVNYWFPSEVYPNRQPQGHALFYIGLHYYLFEFLNFIGWHDPQSKMTLVRFLHALWSLLIIYYGYKIVEFKSGKRVAWYAGIFLAFFWFMPFVSVRNLVEFVCVPAILAAIWHLMQVKREWKQYVFAGLWLGFAFSTRYQAAFLIAGIGLTLLIEKHALKSIVLWGLSLLSVIFITQGVVDLVIWGKPFTEFMAYVTYNIDNANGYGVDVWHMYPDLILGLLIPPLSFLLFAGYFVMWKRSPFIFWSVLFYLAFHTYFPNKQERFIMTVLPLIIISGTEGMFHLYWKFYPRINRSLFRISKVFVISLNLILLPILSVSYSKRHRVEAMNWIYENDREARIMLEDSNKENDVLIAPMFYAGRWYPVIGINQTYTPDSALVAFKFMPINEIPKYVIFWQANNIEARVDSMKKRFPGIEYVTTIEPSFIDKTLYFLNPLNDNHQAFIYRLNYKAIDSPVR